VICLPMEAGIFLLGRRIALNMCSHEYHVHTICGHRLWVTHCMLVYSRKLLMYRRPVSKLLRAFLNTVQIEVESHFMNEDYRVLAFCHTIVVT
jgi:hypothetical protein